MRKLRFRVYRVYCLLGRINPEEKNSGVRKSPKLNSLFRQRAWLQRPAHVVQLILGRFKDLFHPQPPPHPPTPPHPEMICYSHHNSNLAVLFPILPPSLTPIRNQAKKKRRVVWVVQVGWGGGGGIGTYDSRFGCGRLGLMDSLGVWGWV